MYKKQIKQINEDLKKTKKAIIAIGCSFVQGQGAVNPELYVNYKWKYVPSTPLELDASPSEKRQILKQYPSVVDNHGILDFTFMEYDNAFVNVLCKKYLEGRYTPINLGLRGCGNRGSIKELYFHPELHWDDIEECIVIYCPSGLERFDFINDEGMDHYNWVCMWPHYENKQPSASKTLWEGYAKAISSNKFEVMEQIAHVQELMTWCKTKNAKLIVTPGFDRRYDREYFNDSLKHTITRDADRYLTSNKINLFSSPADKTYLLDLFPWENMFKPAGFSTFADLVMSKETIEDKNDHYFQFLGKGSPGGWMTSCAHPSATGHDLFAQHLAKHIETMII